MSASLTCQPSLIGFGPTNVASRSSWSPAISPGIARSTVERTRVAVLNGADGVIFVADSGKKKLEENVLSLKELARNITKQNKKFNEFPLVLQYNKRDLPDALPMAVMDKYLNPLNWQRYEAVASTGVGVFDTLKAISKLVISKL